MKLSRHTTVNKEYFEAKQGPSKAQWREWIEKEIVKGKIIGDAVFIDVHWFAANDVMTPVQISTSGMDLLL